MIPLLVRVLVAAMVSAFVCAAMAQAPAQSRASDSATRSDPRLREVEYDPNAVITVQVQRGVVTHVMLDEAEAIVSVGSGLGAECNKPDAAWCVAAQPGDRHLFVKPKSTASAPNNLAVVTNRRIHALRFMVLPDGDARAPVFRLAIKSPQVPAHRPQGGLRPDPMAVSATAPDPALTALTALAVLPSPQLSEPNLVNSRLGAAPSAVNWRYSLAEGALSEDIAPTLVFDDGRFTYLRFPNNREVPAVFHVQGDGTESLVNARMEGDLLVVDRVSRRLMLRAGQAVVGLWNEAFDPDGLHPEGGTTVPGVRRLLRAGLATETK